MSDYDQTKGELCPKCGWAMKFPEEPCRCELERENAALRKALYAQADYQRELRADRDRLDWLDEYDAEVQKYENSEDGSKRYELWFFVDSDPSPVFSASTLRAAIDAARKEAQPCQCTNGIVRTVGRDNDEVIEDCPDCSGSKEAKP